MIITKLEIENFKNVCRKEAISFCDGLNVITGANGVGKSNLLDSINFVFGKRDKRVHNNKFFFNKKNYSKNSVVKITTDDNQTIEKFLKQYPSGHTVSKYYINGKLSTKAQISDFAGQINTQIIDDCGACMNLKDAENYAKELKRITKATQIIVVSHSKSIIDAADMIHKIGKKLNGSKLFM